MFIPDSRVSSIYEIFCAIINLPVSVGTLKDSASQNICSQFDVSKHYSHLGGLSLTKLTRRDR